MSPTSNNKPFCYLCHTKATKAMCEYNDIETVEIPNGKTVKEVNEAVRVEVERVYFESWLRGVSVPFFDDYGTLYLANPDGSEDKVTLDRATRTYNIIMRTAQPGYGRFAYLMP